MITVPQYLDHFNRILTATETVFRHVPDDKIDWAPATGLLTCGQQMLHIAGSPKVYADGMSRGAWTGTTMEEILAKNNETPAVTSAVATRLLRRTSGEFRAYMSSLSEADLAASVFAPQFRGDVPRWKLAQLFIEHHLAHKAELFTYLRMLGVDIGSRDLYFGRDG